MGTPELHICTCWGFFFCQTAASKLESWNRKNVFVCHNIAVSLHWNHEAHICPSMKILFPKFGVNEVGVIL